MNQARPAFTRIDQVLPSFAGYDAIGTEVTHMRDLLRARGYASDIFAEQGSTRGWKPLAAYAAHASRHNAVIHHMSIGSLIPYYLTHVASYRITRYHNITPAYFFSHPRAVEAKSRCFLGRQQLTSIIPQISECYWPVSHYNAQELPHHPAHQQVLPLLRDHGRLVTQPACAATTAQLKRRPGKTILFVGRVIPSKAQHDLLFLLYQYRQHLDKGVQLICVGGFDPTYLTSLKRLARQWGLKIAQKPSAQNAHVLFTGPVSEAKLVSYYQHADAFVCMSDHEGFCAPLVEAMHFNLPILAHAAGAVKETLGTGGLLVDKRDPVGTIKALKRILTDPDTAQDLRHQAHKRAAAFSWAKLVAAFDHSLTQLSTSIQHARF